jgi:hypothetical protein
MYVDYAIPHNLKPKAVLPASGRPIWWADITPHWDLVCADMAERYRVDLYDAAVLARPWLGVRAMILGLLAVESRLTTALRKVT